MSIAPKMEARVNFPPFVQSAAPVGLPPDPRIGHYLPPSSNKYVQIHTGIVWDSQFVGIKTSPPSSNVLAEQLDAGSTKNHPMQCVSRRICVPALGNHKIQLKWFIKA